MLLRRDVIQNLTHQLSIFNGMSAHKIALLGMLGCEPEYLAVSIYAVVK